MKTFKKFRELLFTVFFLSLSFQLFSQTDINKAIRLTNSELYDDANKMYKDLIKADPKNGDNYYYLGENFLKSYFTDTVAVSLKEMCDSATVYFKAGSTKASLNPLNFVGLGKVALLKNDSNAANVQFDIALSKLPSKTNKLSDITKQGQALTKAKIAEAWVISEYKNLPRAHILLQDAITLDPLNPVIFIILGDTYLEDNDGSNAIANFKKAQELDPKSPLAKMKIGNIYVRGRNLKFAIPFFEEAVEIDPNFAPVYRELGELYYRAGQHEKAVTNYEKYLELSPNISAKVRFAIFKYLIKDYQGCISVINDVMRVDSSFVILFRFAGYSNYEIGKYDEAMKNLDKYFKRAKPEKIRSSDYAYKGRILIKLNQPDEGVSKLKYAYQIDTASCDLLFEIADTYDRLLKKPDTAITFYIMKTESSCSKDIDFYYTGKCYYKMAQYGKADTILTTFIEKQPSSMQGLTMRARTRSMLDSTMVLALSDYQAIIDKGLTDTVKYSKDLIEAYKYYGSYHTIITKDLKEAKKFWKLVILYDPNDQQGKLMLERPEFKKIPDE